MNLPATASERRPIYGSVASATTTPLEQAAQKVLNATDAVRPLQQQLEAEAGRLAQRSQTTLTEPFSVQQYRANH